VRALCGPRHPDGVVVDADDVELDGAEPLWMVVPERSGRLSVSVSLRVLPQPLPLWFCAVTDVGDRPDEAQLATLLRSSASAFHQPNGWPGALRSDGRRTDLGERSIGRCERFPAGRSRAVPTCG
jgi:hypothetical protein